MPTAIAELLRSARLQRGLDQRELAELAGTSQPAVSAYESGRQRPSTATMMRLLDACAFGLRLEAEPTSTSLAGAVRRLVVDGEFDNEAFVLRWLVNQFARNEWNELSAEQRAEALLQEPQPTGSRRWDAFVAALAVYLAESSQIAVPGWTQGAKRKLAGLEWFPGRSDGVEVARQLVALDPASHFVERGIGLDAASLPNMTEAH